VTTSGSRNFTVSRSQIIEEAVANIGVLDPGNTLSAEETARASVRLNLMIKGWMARGANLWRREELILFLQPDQQSYSFIGSDHFAKAEDVVETTLASSVSAGSFTATVDSTSGMTVGDWVGVKLDDGSIFWFGLFSIAGPVLESLVAFPSSASSGAKVYSYPTLASQGLENTALNPIKIAFAYRRDYAGNDVTVRLIGREEYSALNRKSSSGPVTQICHDRQLVSKILVWPVKGTDTDKLVLIVDRIIEDFDTVADTPDFPVEWLNALMWGLSAELANTYGLPISERQWLKASAVNEFESANTFDIDDSTVRFEYAEHP
jgi:hypothetical protein